MNSQSLNNLATQIHEQNRKMGWWDDPNRCLLTCVQLISTEVAEATEGERKNLMDDHLTDRKMGEVELADALIRTLDLGAYLDLKINDRVWTGYYSRALLVFKGDTTIGAKHFCINARITELGLAILRGSSTEYHETTYTSVICEILRCAASMKYDVCNAMLEKITYNAHRHDHTREARATDHGKKF